MRIAFITAGAGGMYCGSCLLDNTLAAELLRRGHDLTLIPVYTPTRTDAANVSHGRVFLGGVNVYLQQHLPLLRRTPAFLDRVWDSAPVLRLATRWAVGVAPERLGALTVSMLRGPAGFQGKEIRKLARFLRELDPEVVTLPNSLLVGLAPEIRAHVRAPIFCTLQGEDLFLDGLLPSYRTEALRLISGHARHVDAFLAVSRFCARHMAGYLGLPESQIRVAPLGIDLAGHEAGARGEPATFTIGYLARVAPEKGLDRLCAAYRRLHELRRGLPPSRIAAAGYLAPGHRPYLERIRRDMQEAGFGDRFEYVGELDRRQKLDFLQTLSILSVPGPYPEPKGLYALEAMASGVPVVQPRQGAFPEILEATGGGVLVDPADPDALARAILSLWEEPRRREELGRKGRAGVRARFGIGATADAAIAVYESFREALLARGAANSSPLPLV
jgi:glycosyltransferase involved in cell wall biosynthesis